MPRWYRQNDVPGLEFIDFDDVFVHCSTSH